MSGFVVSVDRNQKQVIRDLEKMGIQSRSVAGARGAGFDIICQKFGINLLVELKSAGNRDILRISEEWMRDNWQGPWIVAETAEEINNWFIDRSLKTDDIHHLRDALRRL